MKRFFGSKLIILAALLCWNHFALADTADTEDAENTLVQSVSAAGDSADSTEHSPTVAIPKKNWLIDKVDRAKSNISKIDKEGTTQMYLPLYAYHDRSSYSPENIHKLNENALGFGIGRRRMNENGNREEISLMAHLDSHSQLEMDAAYTWQKILRAGRHASIGLGFTAGLTSREDILYRAPVPFIFPSASLNYKDLSLNAAFIPKLDNGINHGNVLFLYLSKEWGGGPGSNGGLGRSIANASGFNAKEGTAASNPSSPLYLPKKLDGDVGLMQIRTSNIIKGEPTNTSILPYVYADYGRFFARLDTFGVKTAELGPYGYLELVTRVSQAGFKTDSPGLKGLNERRNPSPIGVGTFQVTPVGGINANVFYDGISGGAMAEATYAAKFNLKALGEAGSRVNVYPMVGLEYLSKDYIKYLYGVTPQEAAASAHAAYSPSGGTFQPMVGVMVTAKPFADKNWSLNAYVRCKKLGSEITDSPIVDKTSECTSFAGAVYNFK